MCEALRLISEVEITVLVEDSVNESKPELLAKHGLSLFIKAKAGKRKVSILMDAGLAIDLKDFRKVISSSKLKSSVKIIS